MAKKGSARATVDAMDQKWETEEDLRCFMRCAEVKKNPARLKRVQKLAAERAQELKTVRQVTDGKGGY